MPDGFFLCENVIWLFLILAKPLSSSSISSQDALLHGVRGLLEDGENAEDDMDEDDEAMESVLKEVKKIVQV